MERHPVDVRAIEQRAWRPVMDHERKPVGIQYFDLDLHDGALREATGDVQPCFTYIFLRVLKNSNGNLHVL
jgi:hypothetical protein